MSASDHAKGAADTFLWIMPVVPETYERYPLTDQEKKALKDYLAARIASVERATCRQTLHRLIQPIKDLWKLRHHTGKKVKNERLPCFFDL